MKICTKCKSKKPTTEFSKRSGSKGGLQSKCKACNAEYHAANREAIAARKAEYYQANREAIAKYRAANLEAIAAKSAEYYQANREAKAEYNAKYNADNPDYGAKYCAANREDIAAKKAIYRAANREAIAAKQAIYRAANPDKMSAKARNRRARRRNAEGTHTAADIARIFDAQRGMCANCHAKLFKSGKQKFHADHIVPLVRGGGNGPDNLQCLCPGCNLSKGAKLPDVWAKQSGRLI